MTPGELNAVETLSGVLSRVGVVSGAVGVGALVLNDYALSIEEIENGHRLIVRRGTEVQTMDVMNGGPGADGPEGPPGVSPTITITETAAGHRVTVTDVNGSQSFDVLNGTGGGPAYNIGDGLLLDADTNTLSVDIADDAEADNTRPISSAAVYTQVGNIEILLKTI